MLAEKNGTGATIGDRTRALLIRLASVCIALGAWWLGSLHAASPALFPGPLQVATVGWQEIVSGQMPSDVAITLARVAAAFFVSMLAGSLIGLVAGRSRVVDQAIDPWLVVALNLPVLVVVVLVYIWLGLTETAAIVAVAITKIPTVIVTVREGARALDPSFDEMAGVFALPWPRRYRRVILPQMAPYLAAAARSGLSITWKIVLIVELIGRPDGVGFTLNLFFQNFDVAGILAYGLAFAAIMLLLETALLQPLERRVNAWR